MSTVFARGFENALTVALIWLPSHRQRTLHSGPGDLMLALLAALAAMTYGGIVLYSYAGVSYTFTLGGSILVYMTAAMLGLIVIGRKTQSAEIATGMLWALAFGSLLVTAASRDIDLDTFPNWATYGMIPYFAPGVIFLLFRIGAVGGALVSLAFVFPGAAYVVEWMVANYAAQSGNAEASEQAYMPPDTEMIYHAQTALLAGQTERLRIGDPDAVELFAVLGAGYAYEGVFRREVEAVGDLLEQTFGARNRVIRLVNDDEDVATYPLMNRVNLSGSLAAIGSHMDPDDIALIFLTSHGTPGRFSTSHYGVISRDVTPEDVNAALVEAGIGNAVVIVSACYSGSFVDALQAPDRLVLTASAADRNSFGCSDENEWTDWGRAFFTEALIATPDPREAAVMAQQIVAKREEEQGYTPSMPQISEGAMVGAALDAWLADLPRQQAALDGDGRN